MSTNTQNKQSQQYYEDIKAFLRDVDKIRGDSDLPYYRVLADGQKFKGTNLLPIDFFDESKVNKTTYKNGRNAKNTKICKSH